MLASLAPGWSKFANFFIMAWMIIGIIVLLSNQRRRAVHDFMAGTVVVRE